MPPDSAVSADLFFEENGLFDALVARLPDDSHGSFTESQLAALRDAARDCKWGDHPIDIRLSIPLLIRRFYMVVICGPERRSKTRRAEERKRHPLRGLANFIFLACVSAVSFYFFTLLGTAAYIAAYTTCS